MMMKIATNRIDSSKMYYVCHPLTTYGDEQINRTLEKNYVAEMKEVYPGVGLARPFEMLPMDADESEAMSFCLEVLKMCDGIIMLPNWEASKGCREEVKQAIVYGQDLVVYGGKKEVRYE